MKKDQTTGKSLKRALVVASVLSILSGCATTVPGTQQSAPARTTTINKIRLTEVPSENINLGRFNNFPRVTSTDDLRALDSAIASYATAMKDAARAGDWETMMAARHLGLALTEYRGYVTANSLQALRSARPGSDGAAVMTLPAHSYVVLPQKVHQINQAKGTDKTAWLGLAPGTPLDDVVLARLNTRQQTTSSGIPPTGIKVALNTINLRTFPLQGILDSRRPAPGTQAVPAGMPADGSLADAVPQGALFLANEPGGARYFVERGADSWVLINPTSQPVSASVENLGYAPEFQASSQTREEAVRIATRANDAAKAVILALMRSGTREGYCFTVKPNNLTCPDGVRRLDENGGVMASQGNAGDEPAYARTEAYRLAMEYQGSWRYGEPVFTVFRAQCANAVQPYMMASKLTGSGETYEISCHDINNSVIYARQYYVSADGKNKVQTVADALREKAKRDEIERAMAPSALIEGIAQFIPLLGDIDSLAQCAGGHALTRGIYLAGAETANSVATSIGTDRGKNDLNALYRLNSFVSEPPSVGSRTLSCLGGLGIVSGVAKAGRWVKDWLNVPPKKAEELSAALGGYIGSDRWKKLEALSENFGADWVSQVHIDRAVGALREGGASKAVTEMGWGFYAATQQGNNMVDIAEAAKQTVDRLRDRQ